MTNVRQLRLVVTVEDHDAVVTFYRDVLGMPVAEHIPGPDGALVTILDAGVATLEIANREQAAYIDAVEVGRRAAGHFRIALEVEDADGATAAAEAAGAELVAPVTRTPWESRNSRLLAPGELQLTLFEEPGPATSDRD